MFLEYYIKLNEYEYWLGNIGERNSCSKTDHDATMCATKIDYYCHTGLSRPCYNAQIGVSDGIIVNGNLFQRPADTEHLSHLWKDIINIWENIQTIQWQMQDIEVMIIICIV